MPRNTISSPLPSAEETYSLTDGISTIYISENTRSLENVVVGSADSRASAMVEPDSISRADQTLEENTDSKGEGTLVLILSGGTLSCVTTIFAEGDMLSYLLSLVYQGKSVAANVVTNYVAPGITTVPINGILRGVNFDRAKDALKPFYEGKRSRRQFLEAVKSVLPYVVPAILTAGVDVYIGVYTSSSAKALLPPIALNIETVLSFFYMLPIDFLGLYDLHGRLQRFSEKIRGIDDRQQVYERGMAVYAFLKNLSPKEQEEQLREILARQNSGNIQTVSVPTPDEIISMPRECYDPIAKAICEDRNLNDGSSMLNKAAIPVSLGLSFLAGTATSYSPVENVYLKHNVPPSVAWPLGAVSGATKGAFYAVSYDNLFRFWRLGSQLFPSLLLRINVPLVASFAGIGFWEVASHAVKGFTSMGHQQDVESAGMMPWYDAEDPDSRGTEEPPVWYYDVSTLILLAGFVANTAACFGLLLRIMEKRRKAENGLDYAAAFYERSNKILVTSKEMEAARISEGSERDDEEQQLMPTLVSSDEDPSTTTTRTYGSRSSSELMSYVSGGSSCFFHDSQPRRTFGITGCLERTFGRLLGFNF